MKKITITSQCVICEKVDQWEEEFKDNEYPDFTLSICKKCYDKLKSDGETEYQIEELLTDKANEIINKNLKKYHDSPWSNQ